MNELDSNTVFWNKFRQLLLGTTRAFLKSNSFPCWIELTSMATLDAGVRHLGSANETELKRRSYSHQQIAALALRLIQGRNADFFASLRPVWLAFGSSGKICDEVQCAIQTVNENWLSGISNEFGFSSAHAEFVLSMKRIGYDKGVLGKAIRESRIFDETKHVGFPMVFERQSGIIAANRFLRDGFWVTPTKEEPKNPCKPIADAWGQLWETVYHVIGDKSKEPNRYLPSWLHQLSVKHPVRTLDSAGLGLAMQQLTHQANPNLPFGIGFTGRWQDERLGGVRGLQAKMEAAKEAGVFLLFACRDPDDAEPKPVAGLKVVLLPEGLSLREVVRKVNQVCADSGITEYRWHDVEKKLRTTKTSSTSHTPVLPEALDESRCPWGFVGRELGLSKLNKAKDDLSEGRQLIAVTAPPRSGKSTLLGHFAKQHVPYPIWFSFQRDPSPWQKLEDMQSALTDQIFARFGIVALPNANEDSRSLENAIDAVGGRIDLIVDGVDEAESPEKVLNWLQRLPGNGLITIGSHPDFLTAVNGSSRIELQRGGCDNENDAIDLIAAIANTFSKDERLKQIAIQLNETSWIDGLVEKSGGNLWILTEFLSAVERDPTIWPASPREMPLSPNIRTYRKIMMTEALKGYEEDEEKQIREFLKFRATLDNRPWNVNDVIRLAGKSLKKADLSGTGLLTKSVRRVLEFDGKSCRFWNQLTYEAVCNNYGNTSAKRVARRTIQLIKRDKRQDELLNFLIESVPSLLRKVRNEDLTQMLLFKSPWLHLRLRGLAEKKQKVCLLCADLDSLMPSVAIGDSSAVRQMIDWLNAWGWAIDEGWAIDKDTNLVDQWWDSRGKETKPFPRARNNQPVSDGDQRLLAPIVGPNVIDQRYDVPWPNSVEFHGACEILDGEKSYLAFVDGSGTNRSQNLLIYREKNGRYDRERVIRLSDGDQICALASLPYPEVAVHVQSGDTKGMSTGNKVIVFNVRSGQPRVVMETITKIFDIFSLENVPSQLLVVLSRGIHLAPVICILDLNGKQTAEPFVVKSCEWGNVDEIEVIAFGPDCFCLLFFGHREGSDEGCEYQEMRMYGVQDDSGKYQIVDFHRPIIQTIYGVCALQSGRLIVIHDGTPTEGKLLSIVDKAGQVKHRNCLPPGNYSPIAWWKGGIMLAKFCYKSLTLYSVRVDHEAVPSELSALNKSLDPGDGTHPTNMLSISGDRVLFVFSAGAVVASAGKNLVSIERGVKIESTTAIVGRRADGALILNDRCTHLQEGMEQRDNFHFAIPPFCRSSSVEPTLQRNVHVTPDGWEIGWGQDDGVLTGRNGISEFSWEVKDMYDKVCPIGQDRILDVIGRSPQGGVWVAVKHELEVLAVLLPLNNQIVQPKPISKLLWRLKEGQEQDFTVHLQAASGDLLVYYMCGIHFWNDQVRILNIGDHKFPTLPRGFFGPMASHSFSTLQHLGGEGWLILRIGGRFSSGFRNAYTYSHKSGLVVRPDLRPQSQSFLNAHWDERGNEDAGFASINNRHNHYSTLELCTLGIDTSSETVKVLSTYEIKLRERVKFMTQFKEYLVLTYHSGRIEVRCTQQPRTIAAVCYTSGVPHDVFIVDRPEGSFLVVSDGSISWFKLP